jgi:hypothetical protein
MAKDRPHNRAQLPSGSITGGGVINSAISSALVHKRVNRFRVPIATTPLWKIRAIAKYKEAQAAKKAGASSADSALQNRRLDSVVTSIGKLQHISKAEKIACIQKERQTLEHNSELMKNEIRSLNITRSRLLWLLHKSTLYGTEKNHAQRGAPTVKSE